MGNVLVTGPQNAVDREDGTSQVRNDAEEGDALGARESAMPSVVSGIAAVRPNPFRGRVEIVLGVAVSEEQEGRVTVYDVAGRRVRTLHQGIIRTGHTTVGWDGRDDQGVAAVAGVYFVRFQLGSQEFLRKFVKVQ
jgi:hypothetical protein